MFLTIDGVLGYLFYTPTRWVAYALKPKILRPWKIAYITLGVVLYSSTVLSFFWILWYGVQVMKVDPPHGFDLLVTYYTIWFVASIGLCIIQAVTKSIHDNIVRTRSNIVEHNDSKSRDYLLMSDEYVFRLLFPNGENTANIDNPAKKRRIRSLLLEKQLIEDEKILRQEPKDFDEELDRYNRRLRIIQEVIQMYKLADKDESNADELDRMWSVFDSLNASMHQVTAVELERLHDERVAIEEATAAQLGEISKQQALADSIFDATNRVFKRP